MKLPWRNLTGIAKAIAILATIALVCFGLCSVNLMYVGDSSGALGNVARAVGGIAGVAVVLCVPAILVLAIVGYILQRARSRRRNQPPTTARGEN